MLNLAPEQKGYKLVTVKGGKFNLSAQGRDLAPIFCNVTKVKMPSEIKPPLMNEVQLLSESVVIAYTVYFTLHEYLVHEHNAIEYHNQ